MNNIRKIVGIVIVVAVIGSLITLFIFDNVKRSETTRKMYQNAAFHVGDPVTIESSGQPGYIIETMCYPNELACKYSVNTFDGSRQYRTYLREFEIRKRQ